MMTIKTVSVEVACPFCGAVSNLTLNWEDYAKWQEGALVQDAFPYLTPNERELLITGICSDCWDRMFGTDEQGDDWDDAAWHDTCDQEEEEEWEEREDFPDDHLWDSYDLDMGFNPYMGCYDYDC